MLCPHGNFLIRGVFCSMDMLKILRDQALLNK